MPTATHIATSAHGRQLTTRAGDHADASTLARSNGRKTVPCIECRSKIRFDSTEIGQVIQQCKCAKGVWRFVPRLADPNPEPPAKPLGRPKRMVLAAA